MSREKSPEPKKAQRLGGYSLIDSMLAAAESAKKAKEVQPVVADNAKDSRSSSRSTPTADNAEVKGKASDKNKAKQSPGPAPAAKPKAHGPGKVPENSEASHMHTDGRKRSHSTTGASNPNKQSTSTGSSTPSGKQKKDADMMVELRKVSRDILALTGAVTTLKTQYNDMNDYVKSFDEPGYNEREGHSEAEPEPHNDSEPGELSEDDDNPEPVQKKHKCDMLEKLSKDVATSEACGTAITPALAEAVTGIIASGIGEDKLEERQKKYQRPENCESLIVTKINQAVWDSLEPGTRSRDLKLQRVQDGLVKGLRPLVGLADTLFKAANGDAAMPDPETALEQALDAITILVSTHHELNMRRRDLIRPDLKDEYKPMCASCRLECPS